jgi:hypothetical protein
MIPIPQLPAGLLFPAGLILSLVAPQLPDALIVIVDGHTGDLLGPILSDDIPIQVGLQGTGSQSRGTVCRRLG